MAVEILDEEINQTIKKLEESQLLSDEVKKFIKLEFTSLKKSINKRFLEIFESRFIELFEKAKRQINNSDIEKQIQELRKVPIEKAFREFHSSKYRDRYDNFINQLNEINKTCDYIRKAFYD